VTCCVFQVLNLLDPPNKILQAEDTDLSTGMQLVLSAVQCIEDLRSDKPLDDLLSTVPDTLDVPAKRQRFASARLTDCVVYETTGVNAMNNVELRRLYYSVLDHILREMSARFNERNSKLPRALVSLYLKSDTFSDAKAIQPLQDLTNSTIVDTECSAAKQYFATVTGGSDKKMTASRLISEHHGVLKAMLSVLHALKLSVTLGVSTVTVCVKTRSQPLKHFQEEQAGSGPFT